MLDKSWSLLCKPLPSIMLVDATNYDPQLDSSMVFYGV